MQHTSHPISRKDLKELGEKYGVLGKSWNASCN